MQFPRTRGPEPHAGRTILDTKFGPTVPISKVGRSIKEKRVSREVREGFILIQGIPVHKYGFAKWNRPLVGSQSNWSWLGSMGRFPMAYRRSPSLDTLTAFQV